MTKENTNTNKRFLIIHFRVGKTDGVSLEIESWKKILLEKGAKVALCSGPENLGANYVIKDLEQQHNPEMYKIEKDCFGKITNHSSKEDFEKDFLRHQEIVKEEFEQILQDYKPTNIIISNIFSVGEGIPIAGAFTEVLDKYKIPTMLVNHDFYWEDTKKNNPSCSLVKEQLERYFPIDRGYIKNYCINKIAQRELQKRKDIDSELLYDTFDFSQMEWFKNERVEEYLLSKGIDTNSIIVLQATRVVRRKCIEIAIDLVKRLEERKNELRRERYNNKSSNNFHLVLSGYVEMRDREYLEELLEYAKRSSVKVTYLGDEIDKEYDLFDIYPFADIISYPSRYEGFGNQILEAIFARKLVVLFEYPVYKTDLKPKGLKVVSLGDKMHSRASDGLSYVKQDIVDRAVSEILDTLQNKERYLDITKKNFEIGHKNFSHEKASFVFDSFIQESSDYTWEDVEQKVVLNPIIDC